MGAGKGVTDPRTINRTLGVATPGDGYRFDIPIDFLSGRDSSGDTLHSTSEPNVSIAFSGAVDTLHWVATITTDARFNVQLPGEWSGELHDVVLNAQVIQDGTTDEVRVTASLTALHWEDGVETDYGQVSVNLATQDTAQNIEFDFKANIAAAARGLSPRDRVRILIGVSGNSTDDTHLQALVLTGRRGVNLQNKDWRDR